MQQQLSRMLKPSEEGQGLVEYALILVLVAIVVIAILLVLGPAVSQVYETVYCNVDLGSDIRGSSWTLEGDTLTINMSTRTNSTITISGDVSGSQACNGSCTFTFTGVPPSGSWEARSDAGGCYQFGNW